METGAALGWHANIVRQQSVSDFAAAIDGWKKANDAGLTRDEIADIQDMLNEDG